MLAQLLRDSALVTGLLSLLTTLVYAISRYMRARLFWTTVDRIHARDPDSLAKLGPLADAYWARPAKLDKAPESVPPGAVQRVRDCLDRIRRG